MKWNATIFAVLVVAILLSVGCSRQLNVHRPDADGNNDQLPFEYSSDKTGNSPTASLIPAPIPAGTRITIRLQSPLTSAVSHSGDGFDAVLDKPIFFEGQTIAPAGSSVRGRVLAAKSSGRTQDPGFLRITLTEISLHGKFLTLQTSSIFAKGLSRERRRFRGGADAARGMTQKATINKDAGFSTEERLTFRLTQPWPGQS